MRAAALLFAIGLLGCDSADPGTGGAGGTGPGSSVATSGSTATHASSAAVGSTSSSASSTDAATSSSSGCTPTPCPADMCGDVDDGCGGTAHCSLVCGAGDWCASNACSPCQDGHLCESCFPTTAEAQALCVGVTPKFGCVTVNFNRPGCTYTYPVDCDFDNAPPPASACTTSTDRFCRDYFADMPCAGSEPTPS